LGVGYWFWLGHLIGDECIQSSINPRGHCKEVSRARGFIRE
jgi:hypothetical protein